MVNLTFPNFNRSSVPTTVTITEGLASHTFTLNTSPARGNSVVTIKATLNSVTASGNLTVMH
jgi:hypothetical protein